MTAVMEAPSVKDARIAVRVSSEQSDLIRYAAASTGQSLTDFVLTAAIAKAQDALADRRVFQLDDEAWEKFNEILDRPGRVLPGLAKLMASTPIWEE